MTGKRKAGEERRQANFKEAVCYATTEISYFTIQKDRSQYVFWGQTEGSL